jgi:hypothetical protein
MTTADTDNIVIRLDTIDQLFNGPDTNPFSDKSVNVMGESALTLAVRRALAKGIRRHGDAALTIVLPADQITPGLPEQTRDALHRYAKAKIDDNELTIRLSRLRGLIGLLMVTVITLIVLAIAALLVLGPLSGANSVVQGLVIGSASIFAWVIMWDPLERLLFDWVNPALENRILRRMMEAEVVIQPES